MILPHSLTLVLSPKRRNTESERLQSGGWEASLSGRWVDFLQDEQDELLLRYFTEVVCERIKYTSDVPSANLILALHPLDIGEKYTRAYEQFVRDELSSFRKDVTEGIWRLSSSILRFKGTFSEFDIKYDPRIRELTSIVEPYWEQTQIAQREAQHSPEGSAHSTRSGGVQDRSAEPGQHAQGGDEQSKGRELAQPAQKTPLTAVEQISNTMRMIALYGALVTDIRRAWHAIRIHNIHPGWMESGGAVNPVEQQRISFASDRQSKSYAFLFAERYRTPHIISAVDVVRKYESLFFSTSLLRGI